MAEGEPEVTLNTLHGDLGELKGDVRGLRGEVRDLKATMIAGFAGMPTRASSEEMIRLLRETASRAA